MVLIGLVLLAIAVGFTVDVLVQNADPVQVDLMGRTFSGRPGLLVVAGALVLLIFVLGTRLVVVGVRSARRRRILLREAALVNATAERLRARREEETRTTNSQT